MFLQERKIKANLDTRLLFAQIATVKAFPVDQAVHLANPLLSVLQTCMLRIPELNLNYHMT